MVIFHDCYMYAEYNDLGTFRALSVLSLWDLNILYLILCLISSPLFYTLNITIWELFAPIQATTLYLNHNKHIKRFQYSQCSRKI